ncbi:MAG: 30S ribosomal protein S13 [Christensenellaceae bacterium]|jgi:small subunit ribosomal protein S13|nr:30S ribosomal protein S13 [Christensenellaceae bacterium]
MARISGIELPNDKCIKYALTSIYGIGVVTAGKICEACKVDAAARVKDVAEEKINAIRSYIDKNVKTEGDLRRDVQLDIKRLTEIGCYRGIRHRKGLPVRGQSTKQNARTRKGPKKMVIRSKADKK